MNAREQLEIMVRTDPGSMTVWSPAQVCDALDAYRTEVRAERDAQVIAWLVKKATEYQRSRDVESNADVLARMASKISRGAIRDESRRMAAAGQAPAPQPETAPDAEQWNSMHSVGTSVVAYPLTRDDAGLTTRTRSEAWLMGGHTPVVLVEGYAGGIALTHIDVIEAPGAES